jgi:hypothetical protein
MTALDTQWRFALREGTPTPDANGQSRRAAADTVNCTRNYGAEKTTGTAGSSLARKEAWS